jgi:serine/threonine-protein kinase
MIDAAPSHDDSPDPSLVFISYRSQDPDLALAREFSAQLKKAGFDTFLAAESLRIGDEWPIHIENALNKCGHFLLLLSAKSAASDMVIEEVRRVKSLRDTRTDKRPCIMPVRVNLPFDQSLNYDLAGYLSGIHQLLWKSPEDTASILENILSVINTGRFADKSGRQGGGGSGTGEDKRPLPVAEPEWPGGRVPRDSKFYVARPDIDEECFTEIMRPGSLIRLRAPRQMGKTSLLARVLSHAKNNGCASGQISFQLIADSTLSDLRGFLYHFCFSVAECMGLPDQLDRFWNDRRDVFHNCREYFMRYLLREIDRPFVLGLDETDRLFEYPKVAEHFFSLLRGWMDNAEDDELWGKFRVVLVHSTECYLSLSIHQSPFANIGRDFRLPPFSEKQMTDLAHRHGIEFNESARQFFDLVDGHPYLSRLGFYFVARERKSFETIMANAHTEAGVFSDHLRRHYWNLSLNSDLVTAFKTVIKAQVDVTERAENTNVKARVRLDSVPAFKLEGMGLVKPVNNEVTVSCHLYQKYFQDRLGV